MPEGAEGGPGVAVLEPPKPPPVAETPAFTEAPLDHIDETATEEVLDSTVDPKLDTASELDSVGPTDIIETPPAKDISETVDDTPEGRPAALEEKPEKIERNATSEVVSTKEMLRQKLTHDFIEASEGSPESKSEAVIKGDLEANRTKLTPEQIELLDIYARKTINDPEKPVNETNEHILDLVDVVREQIASEALKRGLLSGSHLLPLVDEGSDPGLYVRLEQTAFVDDPVLISEVFASVEPESLDKIQTFLQEKAQIYSSDPRLSKQLTEIQELIKLTPKIKERLAKIPETANLKQLFTDIANGSKPEIVKYVSEFVQKPEAALEILKMLFEDSGVNFDPNFFQKHGKTIGKVSLLAALGLMYALMKSGKEQPQGAY